jgi:TRAP-type C4-dicarboxylate transport system permease small subunit
MLLQEEKENNRLIIKDKKGFNIMNVFDLIVKNVSFIGSILTFLLMILITCDVIGRNVFNNPIPGVPEIVKNAVVAILFLQISHVLKEGRHIRSTLILDRLPQKGKDILDIIANMLGIIIFGLLFYAELSPAIRALEMGDYEGEILKVPTFPLYVIILFGSILMVLQYLVLLIRQTVKLIKS